MNSVERAKEKIRRIIAASRVPEGPQHADNTLRWLLHLKPDTGDALQLAALAHDIDRSEKKTKVKRADFDDYDAFKSSHACNGAKILRPILMTCDVKREIVNEACRLVTAHEVGSDLDSDILRDADSISYFDVNLPLYYQREGRDKTKQRSRWGYRRLSPQAQEIVKQFRYKGETLTCLLREVIRESANASDE